MENSDIKKSLEVVELIGKTVEKLPEAIQLDAFQALMGMAFSKNETSKQKEKKSTQKDSSTDDREDDEFFTAFNHEKPADNVKLIAAYFYKEYGIEPFSLEDMRQKADEVGITIPSRVDMTLAQAKENGKKLFTRAGKGHFKPTVHGEANMKASYSVKKGNKKRPQDEE